MKQECHRTNNSRQRDHNDKDFNPTAKIRRRDCTYRRRRPRCYWKPSIPAL